MDILGHQRIVQQIWSALVHQGETQECGDSSNSKPLSGKRILLVEDSHYLRNTALATLVSLGATNIDESENGELAVGRVDSCLNWLIRNPPYDYILMDCQMPVMNGFEATRQIRKMEKCGVHIPIIGLTSFSDKVPRESGMDFHIVKPIQREDLLEAIRYIHTKKRE